MQHTFKYALICFFPSITHGSNFVLSVIAVCKRPCDSSSSFAEGGEGNDLIKYMRVLKWERTKRGRFSCDDGGADTLLFDRIGRGVGESAASLVRSKLQFPTHNLP